MSVLVAVTCTSETILDGRSRLQERYVLNSGYAVTLAAVGAQAAILPHAKGLSADHADAIVGAMAGVIISGGDFDVPPRLYGEVSHPKLGSLDSARTDFEASLCLAALRAGKPVLGVCGGMQLLNVLFGGTLVQDLSLWPGAIAHEQPFGRARPFHAITIAPGSRLSSALGAHRPFGQATEVNSSHHQLIGRLGKDLVATAWAPDGAIEAIEGPMDGPFILGVQWHPEAMADERQAGIFRSFVRACERETQCSGT